MSDTTITPEERAYWRRVIDEEPLIPSDDDKILRLLNALEAAEARASKLKSDIKANGVDYCALLDRHDAEFVRAERAEAESAQLRAQVGALLELNEAVLELLDACLDEVEAISAHDDYQTGRTLGTETRLKNVRASLFAAYDKGTKAREKCETLGLTVTP